MAGSVTAPCTAATQVITAFVAVPALLVATQGVPLPVPAFWNALVKTGRTLFLNSSGPKRAYRAPAARARKTFATSRVPRPERPPGPPWVTMSSAATGSPQCEHVTAGVKNSPHVRC